MNLQEIRIGVIGSVDSGKSTITGVLTKNILDDGRGSARSHVMRHPHELKSGRTSSIIAHYTKHTHPDTGITKDVTFIDLAGHEKYLKTTINGIHRCQIDYAQVVVGANMGILRMTEEHLTLSLSLAIPTFVTVTKIDIAPENILDRSLDTLQKFLAKKTGGKRIPIVINSVSDIHTLFENYYSKGDIITPVPIFQVSSVSGIGLDTLRDYIARLPVYKDWLTRQISPNPNYVIDANYFVKGIGIVLSGVLVDGYIRVGDVLQLGPINSKFHSIQIKSIHNNYKEPIEALFAGQSGCLNIKCLSKDIVLHRRHIRHGCRVMKEPMVYTEFKAVVRILHHPSTIKPNYEPTIHCGPVCQSAKIISIQDRDCIRLGDTATVKFQFKYRPEYIEPAMKFVFREGQTKGVGKIVNVIQ
jgi:small GTP-binding protein